MSAKLTLVGRESIEQVGDRVILIGPLQGTARSLISRQFLSPESR